MVDETARDVVVESVFQEREMLVKRTRSLDTIEALISALNDEQIEAVLDLPDVLMRAAQIRARKISGQSPCGGPGRPPCGQRR